MKVIDVVNEMETKKYEYEEFVQQAKNDLPVCLRSFLLKFEDRIDKTKEVTVTHFSTGKGMVGGVFLKNGNKRFFEFTEFDNEKDDLF